MKASLEEVFQYLHDHAEISWKEHHTTDYIRSLFKKENCRIKAFDDITGLIIEIGSGKPVVALRADMDALWQEVDGVFQANHSCGHDAHMTIAIGVLWHFLEHKPPFEGTIRFLFQPAEEKGTGALALVEKGIMDDVDYLFGMHLRPIQELEHGYFAPAIRHGAVRFVEGQITGEDAHGARPHLNANAILIGTELFQHINNIHLDPKIPYSVKMTAFHAGGKNANIIPGNAAFSLDLRAQTNDIMEQLMKHVEKIASMLADYHDVEIDLKVSSDVAAAVLHDSATNIMKEAIIECVGADMLTDVITSTGGDDFHFYSIKRPHVNATMLAIGCDLQPGLHHPNMTFNHAAIPPSVRILTKAIEKALKQ
ncbi:M20 peptidase aminoacylase family protein [Salirhabdus sp. Marseille-P4669]|uniref:M20 peptidase aminoacylase family protein n=1 Tax=Salirhabdus sp. Marseille-P4669 TaxID=2042310 RepID=UPI000C7AA99F|nr:M20 peptidase aminoacylase family protein [Salirhabdus sp. Marseille-P4669]